MTRAVGAYQGLTHPFISGVQMYVGVVQHLRIEGEGGKGWQGFVCVIQSLFHVIYHVNI